jgi:hypothetical protein
LKIYLSKQERRTRRRMMWRNFFHRDSPA